MKLHLALRPNTQQFIKDYRLPLVATVAFVVLITALSIGRLHEHTSLGQIFAVRNSGGSDYANLLSNDQRDNFAKRDVSADDKAAAPTNGIQSSANNSTNNNSATITTSGGSTSGGSSGTGGGGTTVTPHPFAAAITDFKQDQAPALQCPGGLLGNINLNKCSKVYSFAASIQTTNGPGTVNYEWRYSVSGSSNGSFVAASGTNVTTLHSQVTISCKDPGNFTAQFALTAPAATQSGTLQINHSC